MRSEVEEDPGSACQHQVEMKRIQTVHFSQPSSSQTVTLLSALGSGPEIPGENQQTAHTADKLSHRGLYLGELGQVQPSTTAGLFEWLVSPSRQDEDSLLKALT